jgi:hypothetical protein
VYFPNIDAKFYVWKSDWFLMVNFLNKMHSMGGIKYNQIHHYLIDWFEKWGPIDAKFYFWKSDWFLMMNFLYLIPGRIPVVSNV